MKQYSIVRGYSPYKCKGASVPPGTVVVVHHEGSDSTPLLDYAPLQILLSPPEGTPPPLILILDLSRLNVSNLDAETETMEVGKKDLLKTVGKAIEKLGLSTATMVTTGKACSLFMKLLITGERLKVRPHVHSYKWHRS